MLGYIDPGSATVVGTAVVGAAATAVTVAKLGWKNTAGKLSPKQRRLAKEKKDAAEAADHESGEESAEAVESETADAAD